MSGRTVVAVGGSAGGVEALMELVRALPPDLPATVLVNLHMSSSGPSLLRQVLGRVSKLPVVAAASGLPLEPGTVVTGVPDRHLLVVDGAVELGDGARENNHRPSHDAMLRSVALECGPRSVGVVLTGLLDDGAVGLRTVARYGGACLVQDPSDAQFGDMPRHALLAVPSATKAPLATIPEEVVRMVEGRPSPAPAVSEEQRRLDQSELASARGTSTRLPDGSIPGEPTELACPDCHGVLFRIPDDHVMRFRCRTGHAWTSESLLVKQDAALEQALWTALRALEERADVSRRLAVRAEEGGRAWSSRTYAQRSEESQTAAETLRDLLHQTAPVAEDGETAP